MTVAKYMLDTNIMFALIKNPHGGAAIKARERRAEICTSVIVASELRYGCAKSGSVSLLRKVEDLLEEIGALPFEVPADSDYGRIRRELELAGQPIGPNDFLIAAHAYRLKLTLVTANVHEFSRIGGLAIENWL